MKTTSLPESRTLAIAGLLVLAVFVALMGVEWRITRMTDPERFHLFFPDPEDAPLGTELCQDGPARDFSVSAFVESAQEPYFWTTVPIAVHGCATVTVPSPEPLPEERPARIRIRATDGDGRTLEIFKML